MGADRRKEGEYSLLIKPTSEKLLLCLDTPDLPLELTGALGWLYFQPTKHLKEGPILQASMGQTFAERLAIMAKVWLRSKSSE